MKKDIKFRPIDGISTEDMVQELIDRHDAVVMGLMNNGNVATWWNGDCIQTLGLIAMVQHDISFQVVDRED